MYNGIHFIVLFPLFFFIFQAASNIVFTKFQGDAVFDDKRCGPEQTLFEIKNTSIALSCARICYKNDFCYSFFLQEERRVCIGCDGFYHNSEDLYGSKYFGRYSGKCSPGWNEQKNRCYSFSFDEKNFTNAQMECRKKGGELVEVGDETENDYLKSMSSNNTKYWLGLTSDEEKADFVWITTGEVPLFSFLPNTTFANASCVTYTSEADAWSYGFCNETMDYICERPQPGY